MQRKLTPAANRLEPTSEIALAGLLIDFSTPLVDSRGFAAMALLRVTNLIALRRCSCSYQYMNAAAHWEAASLLAKGRLRWTSLYFSVRNSASG
jgi:hypothetical protein